MVARISVPLRPESRAAVQRLAHDERRDPREQAAVIVEDELRRRGLLTATDREQPAP